MRCLFGIKKDLMKQIEIDFMPRTVLKVNNKDIKVDLDCFGYCAKQLLELNPKVHYLPNHNMNYDYKTYNYLLYPYVHVRQMNSSIIGFGSGRYQGIRDMNESMINIIQSEMQNECGRFQVEKAVAFRRIMLNVGQPQLSKSFIDKYNQAMDNLIVMSKTDINNINEMVNFFTPLMTL
jgi:hypothetical protein